MTIGRLLFIVGIIIAIYAVVSGIHFHMSVNDGNFSFSKGFNFKIGTFIGGIILAIIGKKIQK